MLARVPAGRLGRVGDIVSLVEWLLREESSYMTGEDLTVDGGLQL
jgi:NAD(P)-dependent dehydrogenase (short-subunit alcohol dehydrogenase family)